MRFNFSSSVFLVALASSAVAPAMARLGGVTTSSKGVVDKSRKLQLSAAPSTVIITEIMYNPTLCADSKGEWIELYNNSDSDVDITNWKVGDSGATSTLNAGNLILAPGDYYIVAKRIEGCDDGSNFAADDTFSFGLNNGGGDTVRLLDNNGALIDSHTYSYGDSLPGFTVQREADIISGGIPTDTWVSGDATPRAGYNSVATPTTPSGPTVETRTYGAYELEVTCDTNAGYTTRFTYELVGSDQGDYKRPSGYSKDDQLPSNCNQLSTSSYQHDLCGSTGRNANEYCFDRGHLVASNHMDNIQEHINEANYMTNILPQAVGFNRSGGAWVRTENIIECSRDLANVEKQVILGGAIYDDTSNDYFVESHGIPTPDKFWKVVIRYYNDGSTPTGVISWIMPNHFTSIDDNMDEYVSTISEIQTLTGDSMPELPENSFYTEETTTAAWEDVITGCDTSRMR